MTTLGCFHVQKAHLVDSETCGLALGYGSWRESSRDALVFLCAKRDLSVYKIQGLVVVTGAKMSGR